MALINHLMSASNSRRKRRISCITYFQKKSNGRLLIFLLLSVLPMTFMFYGTALNITLAENLDEIRKRDFLDLTKRTSRLRRRGVALNVTSVHTPLESFYYDVNPIIPTDIYKPHSDNPLSVIYIGDSSKSTGLVDGLERSRYIRVIQTAIYDAQMRKTHTKVLQEQSTNAPVVYFVDWSSLHRDCHLLENIMKQDQLHPVSQANDFLFYFDLSSSSNLVTCPQIEFRFGLHRVRLAKSSIVEGRHWNPNTQWVEPGALIHFSGDSILFSPRYLRNTFVEILYRLSAAEHAMSNPAGRSRSTDLTMFWRKGDYSHYGHLRRQVASLVSRLNGLQISNHTKVKSLVRILGDEDKIENDLPQEEYVKQMLSSKIIVLAQRDEWEDQGRLFEAMASGALVMIDSMQAIPRGLQNRTHCIIYDSAESLHGLIIYYLDHKASRLKIAGKGWEYAMGKNRAWHRMESLLFGQALTKANKPGEEPY